MNTVDLREFGAGDRPLSEATGRFLAECASVCLANQGHKTETTMSIVGMRTDVVRIVRSSVSDVIVRTHGDLQHAQEHGAYAIGISLLLLNEGYNDVEQSAKTTGVDYYVGDNDGLMFQHKARLEVSSLLNGSEIQVQKRVREKLRQTERSAGSKLPAYVAVVEYSRPLTHLVKHE